MGSIGYGPYIVTVRVSYILFCVFVYRPPFPLEIKYGLTAMEGADTNAHARLGESCDWLWITFLITIIKFVNYDLERRYRGLF
jgi:hypothetical protein